MYAEFIGDSKVETKVQCKKNDEIIKQSKSGKLTREVHAIRSVENKGEMDLIH